MDLRVGFPEPWRLVPVNEVKLFLCLLYPLVILLNSDGGDDP
jgi:hypothetical protein